MPFALPRLSPAADPGRRAALAGMAGTFGALMISGAAAQAVPPSGPRNTGVPGPGPFAGGAYDPSVTAIGQPETFQTFGCKVPAAGVKTPDWEVANLYFERKFFNEAMTMPDGRSVKVWGFEDPIRQPGIRKVPAPLIRVQEGDLVHVRLRSAKGAHTIHHHGIEGTTANDGVGHTSFEVKNDFTYQWQASQAGTFLYHCHVNTVLHFEMGLFGLLVVDPKPNADGSIAAFRGGPVYEAEQIWAFDDMDPTWHELPHGAGLCGDDVGLNIFRPRYFLVSGTPVAFGRPLTSAAVDARGRRRVLIRAANAAYSLVKVTIRGLGVTAVSVDGHALDRPWNRPIAYAPGEPILLSTAMRQDLLLDLDAPVNAGKKGTFQVEFEWQDWITRKRHNAGDATYQGFATTTITV